MGIDTPSLMHSRFSPADAATNGGTRIATSQIADFPRA